MIFLNKERLIRTTILALFASLLSVSPLAQAVPDGDVNCSISGTFTITSNVVSNGITCEGTANIPNGVVGLSNEAFAMATSLTSVIIPNTVTYIGSLAFSGASELTNITIPESVTLIGDIAFGDMEKLSSINVSSSNSHYKDIDGVLFNKSESKIISYPVKLKDSSNNLVTSYVIPNTVVEIEVGAFYQANHLSNVAIPDGVTTIGDYAFFGAASLTSFSIPNSVETIGEASLVGMSLVSTISIPSSVTFIGDYALADNAGLVSIQVDESNQHYKSIDGVLYDESATVLILYPARRERSGYFSLSPNRYVIPNTVKEIGLNSFANATYLTSVTIPASVENIGNDAFSRTPQLTSYIFLGDAPTVGFRPFYLSNSVPRKAFIQDSATGFGSSSWNSLTLVRGNNCFEVSLLNIAIKGENCAGDIVIPEGVTAIGDLAFFGAASIKSVSLPSTLETIGYGGFAGTSNMESYSVAIANTSFKSIDGILFNESETVLALFPSKKKDLSNNIVTSYTIPNSVEEIDNFAFVQTSLSSLTIPMGVTAIGLGAFFDARSLTSLVIPNSVHTIGQNAFSLNTALTNITLPTNDDFVLIDENMFVGASLTSIVIPASVTIIGDGAFAMNENLADIYFLGNAPIVAPATFFGVASGATAHVLTGKTGFTKPTWNGLITSESIPTLAGNYLCSTAGTFTILNTEVTSQSNCTGEALIPEGVTSIGEFAFLYASGLTSVSLPNSLTSIRAHAFNSSGLTSVTVPNSVTTIEVQAFVNLPNVVSAILPSNTNYTVITQGLFLNSPNLTSITIPNSVTHIEPSAFENSGLVSVTIPESVTSLGDSVFDSNPNLLDIYFLGNAPTAFDGTFRDTAANATAHVLPGKTGFTRPTWYGLIVSPAVEVAPPAPVIPVVPVIPTYSISYLGNSIDVSSLFVDVNGYTNGQQINLTSRTPIRPGHTFLGWNSAANGSGTSYAAGASFTMGSADTSLYAQWKINTYSLAFNSNGGPTLTIEPVTREYATTFALPALSADQLRSGYTFSDWNTAANGSGATYQPTATFKYPASDTTLYAQWKINSYSLSYDGNSHERGQVPRSTTQEFNSSLTFAIPSKSLTRKGYTFQGWNTSKDGSGTSYAVGASIAQPATNLTVYARWIPNTYQVKFLGSSKEPLPNGEFVTGGAITGALTPTKPGYIFKGWSSTPSRTQILSFPYSPGVTRNISLYAVWEKKKK